MFYVSRERSAFFLLTFNSLSFIQNNLHKNESYFLEQFEMSGSRCPYKILGVSDLAEDDEIEQAFEVCKQAYEQLTDGKKRGAHDRQAANEKEKVKIFLEFMFSMLIFFSCSCSRLSSLKRS